MSRAINESYEGSCHTIVAHTDSDDTKRHSTAAIISGHETYVSCEMVTGKPEVTPVLTVSPTQPVTLHANVNLAFIHLIISQQRQITAIKRTLSGIDDVLPSDLAALVWAYYDAESFDYGKVLHSDYSITTPPTAPCSPCSQKT
jgi:hypothetical protein